MQVTVMASIFVLTLLDKSLVRSYVHTSNSSANPEGIPSGQFC